MSKTSAVSVAEANLPVVLDVEPTCGQHRLAALPPGMTVAGAMESEEKSFLDWFVRTVQKAKDKERLVAALAFVDNQPEGKARASRNEARAFIESCGGTVEGNRRSALLIGGGASTWKEMLSVARKPSADSGTSISPEAQLLKGKRPTSRPTARFFASSL